MSWGKSQVADDGSAEDVLQKNFSISLHYKQLLMKKQKLWNIYIILYFKNLNTVIKGWVSLLPRPPGMALTSSQWERPRCLPAWTDVRRGALNYLFAFPLKANISHSHWGHLSLSSATLGSIPRPVVAVIIAPFLHRIERRSSDVWGVLESSAGRKCILRRALSATDASMADKGQSGSARKKAE